MCGNTTNYYGTDIQIQFMVNSYLRSIGAGHVKPPVYVPLRCRVFGTGGRLPRSMFAFGGKADIQSYKMILTI